MASSQHPQQQKLKPAQEHDLGLSHDLPTLLHRRRALGLMSATGLAAALAACSAGSSDTTTVRSSPTASTADPSPTATTDTAAVEIEGEIPAETQGPYPANGSNGVDVLSESGVVRSDIRTSFAGGSATASGIPMVLELDLFDMNGSSIAPLAGAAVYVWHCTTTGLYSMYDREIVNENYLRGVQITDDQGHVSFTSIFPGAYPGRWPHVHFEVYPSHIDAIEASNKLRTSQIAFPADVCHEVYSSEGYGSSLGNLEAMTIETDMVFSDGYSLQMAKVNGSVRDGYTVSLNIAV